VEGLSKTMEVEVTLLCEQVVASMWMYSAERAAEGSFPEVCE